MDFQNTEYTILPTEDCAGSSGSTSVQSSEIEAHETYLKKSLEKKRVTCWHFYYGRRATGPFGCWNSQFSST
ncbi:hypothetical protein Tco_1459064 [Tanacetum coccineum]